MKKIYFILLFCVISLTGCFSKEKEKEYVNVPGPTVEVEKPSVELVQLESQCIVDFSCHIIGVTVPNEGLEKLAFGFSQFPDRAALVVNLVEHEIDDWGEIEISLSSDDNVILLIQQSNNEELFVWLDEYSSNGKMYSAGKNTWNIGFKYQKPELHFGIKQITKNTQQKVHSVTFQLSGENNLANLYQADIYTTDGCLVGSGEVGKFGSDIVEIFFTNQCHDNLYFTSLNEVRNYMVRFLSITGEPTWNVLHEGVRRVNVTYYDERDRMSSNTPNISTVKREYKELLLSSPYSTSDTWTDTPAFMFDTIEIEVEVDGEYYIEFVSEACPEFECSPRKGEMFTSKDKKIFIDYLWFQYNTNLKVRVYDSNLSRVMFDITECNITDSDWAASFVCPFRTK